MRGREVSPHGMSLDGVDLDAMRAAARRIAGRTHRTPVLRSGLPDERAGREVLLRAELGEAVSAGTAKEPLRLTRTASTARVDRAGRIPSGLFGAR